MNQIKFKAFSPKQLAVFSWWQANNTNNCYDAIICDGAVRSGKTFCLSVSFLLWSFANFNGYYFGICGKTINSLYRNLVNPLIRNAKALGFKTKLILSRNLLEISYKDSINRFYFFGGKDEGSSALIQGVTLAGVLFDEVALMPRSFVEQALARCSVEGAKFWFNCNPEHPSHWFYTSWIKKAKEKNALYLHFKMKDNPSLSTAVLNRYEKLYSGVFYERYIEGKWTSAYGSVYPMFSYKFHIVDKLPKSFIRFLVSCDYGTSNPSSFGLWGYCDEEDRWYRIKEFYHCSRTTGIIKTDEEYYSDLENLIGNYEIEAVVIDPSAASFIQCIRSHEKFKVIPAKNNILDGIRLVSGKLSDNKIKFHSSCINSIREFSLYRWNLNSNKDFPIQENDHAMDEIRYFVMYISEKTDSDFYSVTVKRF